MLAARVPGSRAPLSWKFPMWLLILLLGSAPVWVDPGFSEKYERAYNIYNPTNAYGPDNPLNPINVYDQKNPLNLIIRHDPKNWFKSINEYNSNIPFQPLICSR